MSQKKHFKLPSFGKRPKEDEGENVIDRRSNRERARDGAILLLEFTTIIAESSELLKPLKVVSGALEKMLKMSRSLDKVNEDWHRLMKKLKFHLATIQNHCAKLEEDQAIDGDVPRVGSALIEPLENYARELNGVYQLLYENRPGVRSFAKRIIDVDYDKEEIVAKTRDMDEAFQRYTIALQQFVATTVDQMRRELAEIHQELKEEGERTHLNHLKAPNAYGNQHSLCLTGTRTKTLAAIRQWVGEGSTARWVFCLLDFAGSGKSTVAKQMAEEWEGENRLLARFFFSRDTTETMSANAFCSTVANAFSTLNRDFKALVKEFQKEHLDWHLLSFEKQFEGLVTGPLKALNYPAILTIDALDECDDSHGGRKRLLETLRTQLPSIPLLRVFVTGRPEVDIKHWAEMTGVGYTNFDQLEGNSKDVETYILSRLQHIPNVGSRVYRVISSAEGLFIWARIACDLLDRTTDVDGLLETLRGEVSLDYLYRVALEQSIPRDTASLRATLMVLQMILAAKSPLSIVELEQLSPKHGIVEQTVNRLDSLLLYKDREDPIRLLHATIREFLTTHSKARNYYIQPKIGHHTLASGCLNILKSKPKDSSTRNSDDIAQRKVSLFGKMFINGIFRILKYSSRSWTHHCTMSYRKLALNNQILEFAEDKLKTWILLVGGWSASDIGDCIGGVFSLCQQNMITRTLVDQTLEQVRHYKSHVPPALIPLFMFGSQRSCVLSSPPS